MRISGWDIEKQVLIVAEIGNNHEGNWEVARELIDKAASCSVTAVKFQTFRTERFVRPSDTERFRRMKSFELPREAWSELARRAHSRGLMFLSTPLDLESVDLLQEHVDAYKIASGDLTFYPLLERVSRVGRPIILSSGLATLEEIQKAMDCIQRFTGSSPLEVAVLHCVSAYPTPINQVNLLSIPYLAKHLKCAVGYSDHVPGIAAAVSAAAVGARIIEKHFTLDKNFSSFRDHAMSADPQDMAELVSRIREVEQMRGQCSKRPQPSEEGSVTAFRRSIVSGGDMKKGRVLTSEDLTWLRPGAGLPPGEEKRLVGRRLLKDVSFGENLLPEDVESLNE